MFLSDLQVSEEEVSSKLLFYTFVPVLKTLPIKITLTKAANTGLLAGKPNKVLGTNFNQTLLCGLNSYTVKEKYVDST